MKIETAIVHPDEWAYGLREGPRMMPGPNGTQSWRWVQTVWVLRGDAIAAHTTDFGPAENFQHVTELVMPSTGEDDTVAQLREHADKNRHDTYWQDRAKEQQANSTLIRDHMNQVAMTAEYARRNHRTAKELQRCRK